MTGISGRPEERSKIELNQPIAVVRDKNKCPLSASYDQDILRSNGKENFGFRWCFLRVDRLIVTANIGRSAYSVEQRRADFV